MKKFHLIVFASLLSLVTTLAFSQSKTRTITGIVKSFEESFPLEGVSVSVKGTKTASGTQADGIYYINVAEQDSILVFSLPGYQTQEIKISADNEYNVILKAGNGILFLSPEESSSQMRCRR